MSINETNTYQCLVALPVVIRHTYTYMYTLICTCINKSIPYLSQLL